MFAQPPPPPTAELYLVAIWFDGDADDELVLEGEVCEDRPGWTRAPVAARDVRNRAVVERHAVDGPRYSRRYSRAHPDRRRPDEAVDICTTATSTQSRPRGRVDNPLEVADASLPSVDQVRLALDLLPALAAVNGSVRSHGVELASVRRRSLRRRRSVRTHKLELVKLVEELLELLLEVVDARCCAPELSPASTDCAGASPPALSSPWARLRRRSRRRRQSSPSPG